MIVDVGNPTRGAPESVRRPPSGRDCHCILHARNIGRFAYLNVGRVTNRFALFYQNCSGAAMGVDCACAATRPEGRYNCQSVGLAVNSMHRWS